MSSGSASTAAKATAYSAMAIESVIGDQLTALLQPVTDLAVLWKLHDIVGKRIRAVEKATRGKPKKERDPDAPKKAAGPQLLAWNAQVARVEAISARATKGKLTYNHARAVAGRLKEAGELNVKKDVNRIPSDETILKAVEEYYASVNPEPAAAVKAKTEASPKKKELKESALNKTPEPAIKTPEKANKAPEPANKAPEKANKAPEKAKKKDIPKEVPQLMSLEPYEYIIDGKLCERIDINGYAFIWNEKGKYMGVYDEKKKTFDTSIPDPTM